MELTFTDFYSGVLMEVSDRANVDIDWNDPTEATFSAGGKRYEVSLDEEDNGEFTVTFSDSAGYGQAGDVGMGAAAVFSGVLTTLREFTEAYEEEKDMKPYGFGFTGAYEVSRQSEFYNVVRSMRHPQDSEISLDEKRKLLKELISRPMLYLSLSLTFGSSMGYSVSYSDRLMNELGKGASDFRTVRRNATKLIMSSNEDDINKYLNYAKNTSSVSFQLVLKGANQSDYTSKYNEASIEDEIDYADKWQVEEWIYAGQTDEILEYASISKLIEIASWGFMHDELIEHDDEDVRRAVVLADYEYGETLADSSEPEHRQQAAELGFNVWSLISDEYEDVRQAAFDFSYESEGLDEWIEMSRNVYHEDVAEQLLDLVISDGDGEQSLEVLNNFRDNGLEQEFLHDRLRDVYDVHHDETNVKLQAAEYGVAVDELVSVDEEEVREAAITFILDGDESKGAVEKVISFSGDYTEENFFYMLDNYELNDDAKAYLKEYGRKNDFDISDYFE